MAETRIERLKYLLGGQLPCKIEQPATSIERSKVTEAADTTVGILTQAVECDEHSSSNELIGGGFTSISGADAPTLAHGPLTRPLEPVFTPDIPIKGDELPTLDTRQGEPSPIGLSFCPFLAVAKFPYKNLSQEYRQPVASAFFDAEKIWNHEWDLYYIWSEEFSTLRPTTFIALPQFQAVLDQINAAFPGLNFEIRQEHRDTGLVIDFDDEDSDLRPLWLGHSNSRTGHDYLRDSISQRTSLASEMVGKRGGTHTFRDKLELANDAGKTKSRSAKGKKTAGMQHRYLGAPAQVERVQRYLGFASADDDASPGTKEAKSRKLSTDVPPPSQFYMDVIFIAIDVESWERNHGMVTEVGVATLDTRNLHDKAPGRVGEEWQKVIRARHFRITENKHRINKDFVHGCPDRFEFGESEFIPLDSMPQTLTSCFHEPFSKRGAYAASDKQAKEKVSASGTTSEQRNIVLVGHDIGQDISYCHRLGFSVLNRSSLIETVDTAMMHRSYTKSPNTCSLGNALYSFNLTGWNLHNAGNDAVYTLWAMLAMCVHGATHGGPEGVADDITGIHEELAARFAGTTLEEEHGPTTASAAPAQDEDPNVEFPPPGNYVGGLGGPLYTNDGELLDI